MLSFPRSRRKAEDVRGRWMVQKIESTCAPVVASLRHGVQTICIEVEEVLRYLSKEKKRRGRPLCQVQGDELGLGIYVAVTYRTGFAATCL